MSTTTTNLGLVKPDYSDTADVQEINQNMDKIDGASGGIMKSIAIVANGNTHAAIASGQYVYVRAHSSLAEGLYIARSAIAVNGALSASNLTAIGNGGLNALQSKYDQLQEATVTWDVDHAPFRSDTAIFYKKGHICQFILWNVGWNDTIDNDVMVASIPSGFVPYEKTIFYGTNRQKQSFRGWLDPNGVIQISCFPGGLIYVSVTYLVP